MRKIYKKKLITKYYEIVILINTDPLNTEKRYRIRDHSKIIHSVIYLFYLFIKKKPPHWLKKMIIRVENKNKKKKKKNEENINYRRFK